MVSWIIWAISIPIKGLVGLYCTCVPVFEQFNVTNKILSHDNSYYRAAERAPSDASLSLNIGVGD